MKLTQDVKDVTAILLDTIAYAYDAGDMSAHPTHGTVHDFYDYAVDGHFTIEYKDGAKYSVVVNLLPPTED